MVIRANTHGIGPFSYHFTVDSRVHAHDGYGHFVAAEEPMQGQSFNLDEIVHVHRRSDDSDIPRG